MKLLRLLMLSIVALSFFGCGSGGGTAGVAGASSGSVAFLVRDAPISGLEALIVTITKVELLGNGDPFVLFEGEQTVNLLEFRDQEFMLVLNDDVPIGSYDKIRLWVTDPEIEPNPDNLPVVIPGNGKLDLNPRESFFVGSGDFLTIRIDFDAHNAVHVNQTGSGVFHVRPVIFVRVDRGFPPIAIADLEGVVLERDLGDGTLLVDVDGSAGQVNVLANDDTTIFDGELAVAGLDVIEVGDRVLVRGHLQASSDLLSDVIFRGDALRLRGILTDGSDAGVFPFDLDSDQPLEGTVATDFVDGARFYVEDGEEILAVDLDPGIRVRLTGRFFLGESLYRVGLVDVELITIEGVVEDVDVVADPPTVQVRDADDVVTTIAIGPDSGIRLAGGAVVELELLGTGQTVEVSVLGELGGLPLAAQIRITPELWEGTVLSIDDIAREIVLDPEDGGSPVVLVIRDDATILRVEGATATMIELEDVEVGDEADAMGLADSDDVPIIFTLIVND